MFKKSFPGLTEWVDGWGCIEIGEDGVTNSLVRLIDEGGVVWESPDNIQSLEKALQNADTFIANWIQENQ